MPRTVANSVSSIDTPVLLLALLALTMTTLVAYDDNVSILLALMVAVVLMAELVTTALSVTLSMRFFRKANSHACHLYCSIVTMSSPKVERQRRYIARINADLQKREQFLMRDRLRKRKR